MRRINLGACILGTFVAFAAVMNSGDAKSDSPTPGVGGGVQAVYGNNIPPDQIEFLSSGDAIISSTSSGSPSKIWETLEHGERVECISCIPAVAPLLYDADPHTREIAAWWLRRRMFGVFGPGEVYQQTLGTLADQGQSPARRADAAYAIGEFLETAGVAAEATAIANDPDPTVRAAAASALGRLNDEGSGALSKALADTDSRVKLAGLASAGRVNTFSDIASVSALLGDSDAQVRRRSAEILDQMRAKDSVGALVAMAQNDADPNARGAACHALGSIGDASAMPALTAIAKNDSDSLVRDLAQIALNQL
ncbi:MAG: HEAT repeat domain-containing protein [Polyangiaceae bacterium]